MRHDQIAAKDSYTKIDVAAVWPANPQLVAVPLPAVEEFPVTGNAVSSPAAPELAGGVGGLLLGTYAMLLGALALATVGSAKSLFAVVIAGFFVLMFFAVPAVFFHVEGGGKRPNFDRFLAQGMDTLTGHTSAGAALVQMLIVPVCLTFGVVAMGVAAALIF
jgi:Flp pilus assembly protein TadB